MQPPLVLTLPSWFPLLLAGLYLAVVIVGASRPAGERPSSAGLLVLATVLLAYCGYVLTEVGIDGRNEFRLAATFALVACVLIGLTGEWITFEWYREEERVVYIGFDPRGSPGLLGIAVVTFGLWALTRLHGLPVLLATGGVIGAGFYTANRMGETVRRSGLGLLLFGSVFALLLGGVIAALIWSIRKWGWAALGVAALVGVWVSVTSWAVYVLFLKRR